MSTWPRRLATFLPQHLQLTIGLAIVLALVLMGTAGASNRRPEGCPASATRCRTNRSRSSTCWVPTRWVVRCCRVIILGTPLTMRVGLIAGVIGLGVGIIFGFAAGYYGGWVDTLLRGAADVFLTIPGLLILVVIASTLHSSVSVNTQALVVSLLAWMWPTRPSAPRC